MRGHNLTREEAGERARLVTDLSSEVALDLTREDRFTSESVIRFSCPEPGVSVELDLAAVEVAARLNGAEVSPEAHRGNRLRLDGLAAANEVRISAAHEYSKTGKGMNRFRDPVDGLEYCHSDCEPFDAYRVYPCFDQPDLKGPITFRVKVPAGWEVFSNTRAVGEPETSDGAATWSFEPTLPVPPYITAVVAGPFHVVRDRHGPIELSVACRQSMAQHLEPEEWLELTKQGFGFFEDAFGYPYPFGTYDQVVVPEFAAGAMENAGCVTFNESYLFRSRVTRAARERRADTILHEMAHMWFGNLVTMRWWNDLWLNESFASYAAVLGATGATRFAEGWVTFTNVEKAWAYMQDQLPTTHPIVASVPDVESVHLNFDGITYAKGASVLKQLVAWVGLDRFLEGMKAYFARHEFGNTELADFLAALEETSGRDLNAWSKEWLETEGVNTLRSDLRDGDGTIERFEVVQEPPAGRSELRSHRVAIGLYDDDGSDRLVRRRRVELDVVGERTEAGDLAGEPASPLVLVNDADLTYAKIRLDERSLETTLDRLGDVEDPLARALLWGMLWDMTRDAELRPRRYLEVVLRHAIGEPQVGVLESQLAHAAAVVQVYGDPANRDDAGGRVAAHALEALRGAEAGSDHQLAWARAFVSAARSDEHVAVIRALLDGSTSFEGLAVDTELRWLIVHALAAVGVPDAERLVAAEQERDPSDRGRRNAAAARAARPTAAAKAEAWTTIREDRTLTLAVLDAVMRGFQQRGQDELLTPYAERYFAELPAVWAERELEFILRFGELMYPRLVIDPTTVKATDGLLARDDLPGPVRRLLLEGKDAVERALRTRAADRED